MSEATVPSNPNEVRREAQVSSYEVWRAAWNRLFGYDFFISYAWKDGRLYAEGLERALAAAPYGYHCFIDQSEMGGGASWRTAVRKALRRSSALILVASPVALLRPTVFDEIKTFSERRRPLVPIDFGDTIADLPPDHRARPYLEDRLRFAEQDGLARLAKGAPSGDCLEFLRKSFGFVSVARRRMLVLWSLVVFFAALTAVAGSLYVLEQRARQLAVAQRTEATARRLSAEAQLALADPLAAGETPVRNLLASLSLAQSDTASETLDAGVRRLPPPAIGDLPWPEDAGGPRLLRFSPDGRWLGAVTTKVLLVWDLPARRLALRYSLPGSDWIPSLEFASGSARALLTLRTSAVPKTSGMWGSVDIEAGRVEMLTSDEVLDAMVFSPSILVLCRDRAPAAAAPKPPAGSGSGGTSPDPCARRDPAAGTITLLDLTSGMTTALDKPDRFGAAKFGRLFVPSTIDAASMFAAMTAPRPPDTPDREAPMAILADDQNAVFVVKVSAPGAPPMPLRAAQDHVLLDVDGRDGLLAVRQQTQEGDAVLRLPGGQVAWRAPAQSVHFREFVLGGRFIVVADTTGPRLQSLTGGPTVRQEDAGRTDWDAGAIGDIGRYTPIIAVETAEASGRIVTAWKDGRIALWRAGATPRPGSFGAMPMPNFEAIARFDHGQDLGVSGTRATLPVLFVSPSGRLVASQSLGVSTNTVGGLTGFDPLLRIWDANHQAEVARLRTGRPMVAAFAPDDRLMATVQAAAPGGEALRLQLWNLEAGGPEHAETRDLAAAPLPPAQGGTADRSLAALLTDWFPLGGGQLWLGADLRLRYRKAGGAVIVLEDLRPVLTAALTRALKQAAGPHASDEDRMKNADAFIAPLEKAIADMPAELPIWGRVAAISGDGRRAIMAAGSFVRIYALDDSPRLLRVVDLSSRTFEPMAVLGLVLSRDGTSFAASIVVPQAIPQSHRGPFGNALRAALLVFRGDSDAPVYERASSAFVVPGSGFLRPIERPLAISRDGRFLALDVTRLPSEGDAPLSLSARASVLDLDRNQEIVALPPRILRLEPFGSWELDGADEPTAAFDTAGTRVVFMRDAPDCLLVTETTMSMMPIKVPGCTQRRIAFSLWDLRGRERISQTMLVKETGSRMASPAQSAMMRAVRPMNVLRFASVPAIRLDLPEPTRVSWSAVEASVTGEQSSKILEISEVRDNVVVRQDSTVPLAACARLPPELARTDPATWAALLPLERYRPICPTVR